MLRPADSATMITVRVVLKKTVIHVLMDCLRLKELRSELNREVGDTFNSVLSLLGDSRESDR